MKGGLRDLYRTLELPGTNPLKDAHAALDTAVLTAYGFDPKKDLLAQLLAINLGKWLLKLKPASPSPSGCAQGLSKVERVGRRTILSRATRAMKI